MAGKPVRMVLNLAQSIATDEAPRYSTRLNAPHVEVVAKVAAWASESETGLGFAGSV